jgi:hypothetical protein
MYSDVCGLDVRGSIPSSGKYYSVLHIVQTGCGVLSKYIVGLNLTTHFHLVPRQRMVEPYLHSPMYFHGIMHNYIINYRDKFTVIYVPVYYQY